jgi:hypothetical protein
MMFSGLRSWCESSGYPRLPVSWPDRTPTPRLLRSPATGPFGRVGHAARGGAVLNSLTRLFEWIAGGGRAAAAGTGSEAAPGKGIRRRPPSASGLAARREAREHELCLGSVTRRGTFHAATWPTRTPPVPLGPAASCRPETLAITLSSDFRTTCQDTSSSRHSAPVARWEFDRWDEVTTGREDHRSAPTVPWRTAQRSAEESTPSVAPSNSGPARGRRQRALHSSAPPLVAR